MAMLKEHRPPISITDEHHGWYLCGDAERRLVRAIADDAVVLVNDLFLVKLRGRLAGLALCDTTTADGTAIKAGTWYAPVDARSRQRIRHTADRGATEITLRRRSTWVQLRAAQPSRVAETDQFVLPDELVAQARTAANRLPGWIEHTARGTLSRRAYRLRFQEASGYGDQHLYHEA